VRVSPGGNATQAIDLGFRNLLFEFDFVDKAFKYARRRRANLKLIAELWPTQTFGGPLEDVNNFRRKKCDAIA